MFFVNRKLLACFFFCISLQACTQLDDYLLGKDNTPRPSTLAPLTATKLKFIEQWSSQVGKPNKANAYLKLKPSIRDQVIYTANTSGTVQAIQQATGKLLWSIQLNQGVTSGPTVASGYIAVGTDASRIILLAQHDGRELWRSKLSGDALSKPVITHQEVIAKTVDGNLYAFDLKTGKKRWLSEHGAPGLILKASSSPVIMDKLILVGFSDGKLDAIDIESGRVIWQRGIAYASGASDVERLVDIDADPIVRGDSVYLASYQGYVGALSLTNGEFIWRKPASVYKNMAMDATTLYLTDSNDVLWAMDRQNGQVKWKQLSLKARGLTEPVLMGNRLIVGDRTGLLHVLSTQNGELIGRHTLSSPVDIAPAVAGGHVYVMTTDGKLTSLAVSS